MSYLAEFEKCFIRRTRRILGEYEGEFEATLLINCALGMLVVPRERFMDALPDISIGALSEWGVPSAAIRNRGAGADCNSLRGFVRHMRNAVAHISFNPNEGVGEISGFTFSTDDGFCAVLEIGHLRAFVEHLAEYLVPETV